MELFKDQMGIWWISKIGEHIEIKMIWEKLNKKVLSKSESKVLGDNEK